MGRSAGLVIGVTVVASFASLEHLGVLMNRKAVVAISLAVSLALAPGIGQADSGRGHGHRDFRPGADGAGDPYFPLDGNGGYDVQHYDLDVKYDPATDVLTGEATITARTTQDLSSFNLDFEGLTVRSIKVDGKSAEWSRNGGELTVVPRRGLDKDHKFETVVRYDGIPATIEDPQLGPSGFFHTDDGAMVIGEPDVAATWFPVNDHPSDKASYTFKITAPADLEVVANGVLKQERERRGWKTWTWDAREPMASYLATMAIGQFDVHAYRDNGIKFWDAIDPDLFTRTQPRTGDQYAISQVADLTYKRLAHTITVPVEGAQLSFWVDRDTEFPWDFAFVEAHTVDQDDWTTLEDLNGHTSQDTGFSCPFWLGLHPFLTHYETDDGAGGCTPAGTSGNWWAATGASDGYEQWSFDLTAYAGSDIELSISYASDDVVQRLGLFVDDVDVSTGEGTTSFENDGDTFDGWTVPGSPEGSAPNANDWIAGTPADGPETAGDIAQGSFNRESEILGFLADNFGPYPFSSSGGIVDDIEGVGFALETQTRPVYARDFFGDSISGDNVVVHELAHQWFGDSLAVEAWQHIWLNEGFATYAEWLWSEHEGLGTAQENFDFFYGFFDEDHPFWTLTIGDPGPDQLFDFPVYSRGAMTLHQLRLRVGDDNFFTILREWASSQAGGNVTTDQFIALSELISGQDLDDLFQTWLFTPGKPVLDDAPLAARSVSAAAATSSVHRAPAAAHSLLQRYGQL
jgi:Peptidase family M1 domain/Peptidase M1 N-terminal domain/Immune inhibitor A peptidase M6